MRKLIFVILFLATTLYLHAQYNSRNGYYHSAQGTIRAFFVFAEALNDPDDRGALDNWQPGQLPPDIANYVDPSFTNYSSIQGWLTEYFYEASCGNFIFLGDYYPELVQIEYSDIVGDGKEQIVAYLNNLSGTDIETEHGYFINSGDFDQWTPELAGEPKLDVQDDYLDCLIILWRTNSKYIADRDGANWDNRNTTSLAIKDKIGVNSWGTILSDKIFETIRHEFGHALLGQNNWHSGGSGSGTGTFLSDVGGYSLLSSWNKNLESVNGWDRWRLGWFYPSKNFEISALASNRITEVNTDLVYGQTLADNEFILRDFTNTGDVVRIELPYILDLKPTTKKQYLWIENHKLSSVSGLPSGIRLNIQVGNDDITSNVNSTTSYISPLSAYGNYDFSYTQIQDNKFDAATSNEMSNPFTGYHFLQQHAINYIEPNYYNSKTYTNQIFNKEFVNIRYYSKNGSLIVNDDYIITGSEYDAFDVGSKISISSNPVLVPKLTFRAVYRNENSRPPRSDNEDYDNEYIYLNGLSVEVLSQEPGDAIKIRIKWDEYDIENDVRWCGPIILSEEINLLANKRIDLDLGKTPTRPIHPLVYKGNKYYTDPSYLKCRDNAEFTMNTNSKVEVKNLSSLILEEGSSMDLYHDALITIREGCTFVIEDGAELTLRGSSRIEIEDNAFICIEPGATINLQDPTSVINLRPGYEYGVNTSVLSGYTNCMSNAASASTSGSGDINLFNTNIYVQNETINSDRYYAAAQISFGKQVTTSKPYGEVFINNGTEIIVDSEYGVLLDKGFTIYKGADVEIR